jgi:predicted O-methyltransferase YrrM
VGEIGAAKERVMRVRKFVNKWARSVAKRLPGPRVPQLVPTAALSEIFPGADDAEVTMLPRLVRTDTMAMPEHELLVLGALVRALQPQLIVEFGTFQGGSTLVMAANMPESGRIVTIDIAPTDRPTHVHGLGVGMGDFDVGCLFRGTRFAHKIEQRFANTVEFSERDLIGQADLVFVDADHTYEFVKRDTETAQRLLKADGSILWHDYTWEPRHRECVGVTRAVNEFWLEQGGCRRIDSTRFAFFTPALLAGAQRRPSLAA